MDAEKVAFLGYDSESKEIRISMWEEMDVPVKLVQLNYQGPEANFKITNPGQTGAALVRENDKYYIEIHNKTDYEVPAHQLSIVFLSIENVQVYFVIELINILDNEPVMSSASTCSVEEGRENFLSNCEYTVFHADGFVPNGILGKDTNVVEFELPGNNADLFKFEEVTSGGDNYKKQFKLKLVYIMIMARRQINCSPFQSSQEVGLHAECRVQLPG